TQKVGIDIEEISQRMPLLASRFLTAKEMKEIDLQNSKLLHVYWGAKECLYKIYADTHILFSEHLSLLPFDIEKDSQTTAYIDFNKLHAQHKVIFRSVDNYMLVIVC
ncbi:MAG: 4'-phosphopantetheinyl transferase superfamily protein, partial [Bacteroidales bacterium]|nr:4'-phosphopantetheinyl transferase superfamily protein [Bacteroidales bacterium]